MKRTPEQLKRFLGEEPPKKEFLDLADRILARASIQPGRDAEERLRLSIAFEVESLMHGPGTQAVPNSVNPTENQLRILRHMLGIDKRAVCAPYRDHYCASVGDPELQEMARLGLVALRSGPTELFPYDNYVTTELGRNLAIASQRLMIPSRRKQKYQKFLSVKETIPDLTFLEFLKNPELHR